MLHVGPSSTGLGGFDVDRKRLNILDVYGKDKTKREPAATEGFKEKKYIREKKKKKPLFLRCETHPDLMTELFSRLTIHSDQKNFERRYRVLILTKF